VLSLLENCCPRRPPIQSNSSPPPCAEFPTRHAVAYVNWRTQSDHIATACPKSGVGVRLPRRRRPQVLVGQLAGKRPRHHPAGIWRLRLAISWKWQDYKDESPWGVHDLAGGVAEWTQSAYDRLPSRRIPSTANMPFAVMPGRCLRPALSARSAPPASQTISTPPSVSAWPRTTRSSY